LAGVLLLLLVLPVVAQEEPGPIARVFVDKAKAGKVQQYEEAVKQHIAWHREQGDTWSWVVRQIESGEALGQYVWITSGHHWGDFDNPGVPSDEDAAHFDSIAGQYVESSTSVFYRYLDDVSRPLEGETPAPVGQAIFFQIRRGKGDEFMNAVKKVHQAIEKTDWPARYFWVALVSGGYQPTYVLVIQEENWAGLSPSEKSFEAMLEEAYGRQEAKEIQKVFDKTIKSERSQISVYRPDLSYFPAAE
jgi:hypothetical protein